MNQLLGQVEEGGPRPCGVEGKIQLKYGDGRKLLAWLLTTSEDCSESRIKISVPPSFPATGRFCFFCPADSSSENNRRPSSSASSLAPSK